LTLEELKEFDTDDLAGRRLYIIGEYNEKKDPEHKFLRPTGYVRLKSSKSSSKAKPAETAKPEPKPEPARAKREEPKNVEPDDDDDGGIPF
jgi:hypothetical protein